jgi:hypothetical protein
MHSIGSCKDYFSVYIGRRMIMTKVITPVKEATEYDNFLNKKTELPEEARLFDDDEEQNERDKYWVDMPEFVQNEKKTYKTIYLHFRNEEDFNEFVEKYKKFDEEQTITQKTKSMWYPHLDKDENSLKRWFEE